MFGDVSERLILRAFKKTFERLGMFWSVRESFGMFGRDLEFIGEFGACGRLFER